ncbi:UNKNOWN [Stylonychia lemnae]|uniref:Uncharacterized protein n=1 Tax=Stylonychia lemnae TaxID=5949 RepID=A0A078AM93_STYLE|nr:UNKNOWN [Stylonychia lemnae]|eukprot:CDW83319.1 UNKNOWN [Stylonychia lemnae]
MITHKEIVEKRRQELKKKAAEFKNQTQLSLERVKNNQNVSDNKKAKFLHRQQLAELTQKIYQDKKEVRNRIMREKSMANQQKSIFGQQHNSELDQNYNQKIQGEVQEKINNDLILKELEMEEQQLIANLQFTIRKEQEWIERIKDIEQQSMKQSKMFTSTMTTTKKTTSTDKPIKKRMDSELETNPNSPGNEDDYLMTP